MVLSDFIYKLTYNDYIQLKDTHFYHNFIFENFRIELKISSLKKTLLYLHKEDYLIPKLSDRYYNALLEMGSIFDNKVMIIITNNISDYTPFDLYSIICLANSLNITIFCISFD